MTTSDRVPLDPDRWVIVYQGPGSGDLQSRTCPTERAADEMTRRLIAGGCVVHAARSQRDLMRAIGARG